MKAATCRRELLLPLTHAAASRLVCLSLPLVSSSALVLKVTVLQLGRILIAYMLIATFGKLLCFFVC